MYSCTFPACQQDPCRITGNSRQKNCRPQMLLEESPGYPSARRRETKMTAGAILACDTTRRSALSRSLAVFGREAAKIWQRCPVHICEGMWALSALGIPVFQAAPQYPASRTARDPRLRPKDWGSAPPERALGR